MFYSYPKFKEGERLTTTEMNAILEEVLRRTKLFAAPPVFVQDGYGGATITFADNKWLAVVCSQGETGGWNVLEVIPAINGTWQLLPFGRSGIAYEFNNNSAIPLGKVVQIKPGFQGEYIFECYATEIGTAISCVPPSSSSSSSSSSSGSSESYSSYSSGSHSSYSSSSSSVSSSSYSSFSFSSGSYPSCICSLVCQAYSDFTFTLSGVTNDGCYNCSAWDGTHDIAYLGQPEACFGAGCLWGESGNTNYCLDGIGARFYLANLNFNGFSGWHLFTAQYCTSNPDSEYFGGIDYWLSGDFDPLGANTFDLVSDGDCIMPPNVTLEPAGYVISLCPGCSSSSSSASSISSSSFSSESSFSSGSHSSESSYISSSSSGSSISTACCPTTLLPSTLTLTINGVDYTLVYNEGGFNYTCDATFCGVACAFGFACDTPPTWAFTVQQIEVAECGSVIKAPISCNPFYWEPTGGTMTFTCGSCYDGGTGTTYTVSITG